MMQAYAGPVQQGDMVVRANEVSPGITALLSKQNRKGAQGIYELPSAKPANPDYYNMALGNVQNEIRSAAQTVNAMAPEGERLAYVSPEEEGILKLLGGAGEPQPVTGIPSYFRASQFSEPTSPGTSRSGGIRGATNPLRQTSASNVKSSSKTNSASPVKSTGFTMATSPETGGRQTYYATDAASAEAVGKAREAAQRAQQDKSYTTPEQVIAASARQPAIETMASLAMEGAEKEKGFFEKLFGSTLLGKGLNLLMKPIENYNFNWYMENVNPAMGKKFAQLSEAEQAKLKENPYLIPGYSEYWEGRRQQAMMDQEARSGRDSKPQPVAKVVEEEIPTEEEEEIPYFSYYRKLQQPMSYADIIKRAYEGSSGPLLESFQEAIDREKA